MSDLHDIRTEAIAETMDEIRSIESELGVSQQGLDAIRDRLVLLSARQDLFSLGEFPAPTADDGDDSFVYRLSQDDDDRFALYIQATNGSVEAKPHDHTTWACIVGLVGLEDNRFFDRSADGGVVETGGFVVEPGTGVTMFPDDVHTIRVEGEALMFHCYGLALERLVEREFYDAETNTWVNNGGPRDIREARQGRSASTV